MDSEVVESESTVTVTQAHRVRLLGMMITLIMTGTVTVTPRPSESDRLAAGRPHGPAGPLAPSAARRALISHRDGDTSNDTRAPGRAAGV